MKAIYLSALIVALAGCAAGGDAQVYQAGLVGQRVAGNEAYVSVSNVWNEMDALPLAETHCKQFGKIARFNAMERHRAVFDCIPSGR